MHCFLIMFVTAVCVLLVSAECSPIQLNLLVSGRLCMWQGRHITQSHFVYFSQIEFVNLFTTF